MQGTIEMAPPEKRLTRMRQITFDYAGARNVGDVVGNMSGIATDGEFAWTVSDEGRSFECLRIGDAGFRLEEQYRLDDFFPDLPSGHEADLESVDVFGGRLWLGGSHCRVRREPQVAGTLDPGFKRRPSRHLLGSIELGGSGKPKRGTGRALPFTGDGSLRRRLRENAYLSGFLNLPSKENGLDIEGLALKQKRLLLGLRGPVIDSHAIVVSLPRKAALLPEDGKPHLHMLDLGGLGVRDLARDGEAVLVIAGPVTRADGPFRIHRWEPSTDGRIETPPVIYEWATSQKHPEGLCPFAIDGRPGILVVYDESGHGLEDADATVSADWLA